MCGQTGPESHVSPGMGIGFPLAFAWPCFGADCKWSGRQMKKSFKCSTSRAPSTKSPSLYLCVVDSDGLMFFVVCEVPKSRITSSHCYQHHHLVQ